MPRYRANCKVCQIAQKDAKLRVRLRKAAFNRDEGGETLKDIAIEYGMTTAAVYNHAKKHIQDTSEANEKRHQTLMIRKQAEIQAKAQKEFELALKPDEFESTEPRTTEIMALDDYIAQGYDEIKKGTLKITASSFLAAVKIRTDQRAKSANNKIELIKTINAFRSSNGRKQTTTSDSEGTPESRGLYRGTSGNEAPSGTEEVSPTNPETEPQD